MSTSPVPSHSGHGPPSRSSGSTQQGGQAVRVWRAEDRAPPDHPSPKVYKVGDCRLPEHPAAALVPPIVAAVPLGQHLELYRPSVVGSESAAQPVPIVPPLSAVFRHATVLGFRV